ncbi:MAG TPA: BTAD domain-containing putative transcriptional regulator [Phototrophicaceae bacterium]|jgi:two-component SAPR family response regulator|nr:BTAD domain-containing putative transcriptional regulator [Phototrophicaceae bacterium]
MIQQIVTRVSFDSFRQRTAGKKVVLLYPWTNYRNLFLSHFLNNAKDGLLYYRIPSDETKLVDWLEGLVNELDNVLGGFGKQTRQAMEKDSAAQIGEALAADLGKYNKTDSIVLYIDELDRVPLDDEFQKFIKALISKLPKNVQLAFSSRMLTHQPWYDLVTSGDAIVLGTEHRKSDVMFTVEDEPKPQLEVYALGRGYALVNGQQITNWDGALPRNLFFFFIDRPLVTRDEIFEMFWPTLSVKEATNVFHVTKRKISERITMKVGSEENYELTQYSSGFYMPSDKVVRHYDVSDFQEALEQALVATDERKEENLFMRSIDLYKAPFLQTINMKWVEDRREHLRTMYAQALIGMGRIHHRRGDAEKALGYFVRSLKETPEREDIHREVMRLYLQLGMVHDARVQYQRLEETLQKTVGISPSRESREVYEKIEAAS